MIFNHFSSSTSPTDEISIPTASMSSSRVDVNKKPPVVAPTRSDTTSISQTQSTATNTSSKLLAWMIPMKRSPDLANDASSISSKKSFQTVDEVATTVRKNNIQRVDSAKLYEYSTKDLHLLVSMSVFSVPLDAIGEETKAKKMNGTNGIVVNGSTTTGIGASNMIISHSTTVTSVALSSVLDNGNNSIGGSSQKVKVSDIFEKNVTTKIVDKDR